MNKSGKIKQNISFNDLPFKTTKFEGLPTKVEDYDLTDYLISEVGEPVIIPTLAMGPVAAFELRKRKNRTIPHHLFGQLSMGDAMQAPAITYINMPVVGTSTIINPSISTLQTTLCSTMQCVRADSLYIIYVDPPLGSANELKASPLLMDDSVEPIGVRWRTNRHKCIAIYLPWESDINMQHRAAIRKGNTGLSIKITNVEDNTTDAVVSPIMITIIQMLCNVQGFGYRNDTETSVLMPPTKVAGAFNSMLFNPAKSLVEQLPVQPSYINLDGFITDVLQQEEEEIQMQSDPNPAIGEPSTEDPQFDVVNTPVTVPAEVVAPVVPAAGPHIGNQQGAITTKWVEVGTFTLGLEDIFVVKTVKIDYPTLAKIKGENQVKPLSKNVFFRGSKGMNGLPIIGKSKIVVSKPVQITALAEMDMGYEGTPKTILNIGGAMREWEIYPSYFRPRSYNEGLTAPVKLWNQDSIKCADFSALIRVKLIHFNRTSDLQDLKLTVLFKPALTYYIPTKPRPPPKATTKTIFDAQLTIADVFSIISKHITEKPEVEEIQMQSDDDIISSLANSKLISGETLTFDTSEESQPNECFVVRLGPYNLVPGEIMAIPLDLPNLVDTLSEEGELNEITEKIARFAHHVPTKAGQLGPIIGTVRILTDLPVTSRAQLASVVLPADMNDEVVVKLFGLGSILGLATSALTTIGGPLLTGAISAGAGMLNSVVPGLGSMAGGLVNNLIGQGKPQEAAPSVSSIEHEIPFPRFQEVIRYLLDGSTNEPMAPTVLLQLMSLMTGNGPARVTDTVPVYLHLRLDSHGTERMAYNRTEIPVRSLRKPEILIDDEDIAHILSRVTDNTNEVVVNKMRNLAAAYFTKTSKYINALELLENIQPITNQQLVILSRQRLLNNN